MKFTKTFEMLCDYRDIPIKIVKGGTRSGKTYGILQYKLIDIERNKKLTSVISETLPHLKKGAFRTFKNVLQEMGGSLTRDNFNMSELIYKDVLEFFSADSDKAHGPEREDLFMNEIQNIQYETAFHLMQRTNNEIILDYNPTHRFWIDEMYLDNPKKVNGKDYILIHSTIFDNPYVSDNIKQMVLDRAEIDENYRRVYLEGETGSVEGLIIKNYKLVDKMPEVYKWRVIGIDFGYVNDPTAIIDVRFAGGEIWVDEYTYETGLVNIPNPIRQKSIIDELQRNNVPTSLMIIADSAEMKSIAEIRAFGYYIKPAIKGKDSIKQTIDILQRYTINITKNSLNMINEVRNYKWKENKDNNTINEPIDAFNHTIDPLRYIAQIKLGKPRNVLC